MVEGRGTGSGLKKQKGTQNHALSFNANGKSLRRMSATALNREENIRKVSRDLFRTEATISNRSNLTNAGKKSS